MKAPLVIALLVAAALFVPGINWGLPSRAVDPFLFGEEPVWTGEKIASLLPSGGGVRGADVDQNPVVYANGPVVLNHDDRQRAEIIARYRLYSHQPDEMITFRSLATIKQFRGDPRLYQYGGLWIYPVGAMLQAAKIVGLVDVRADQAFYLDHPEAFGRFYVVARAYTVMWGLVAVAAVYWIVRRLTSSAALAAAGAIAFAAMPVVVTMAHEAKPHLPGLALTLLAVIAATKYVDTGRVKWAVTAGICCGGAFGMVLSGLLAFAILPMMVFLRPVRWGDRFRTLFEAGVIGVITYVVTNPFVLINALNNREMLKSNLGNSTDMYRVSFRGVGNALRLIVEGASPVVVIGGAIALVALLVARARRRDRLDDIPGRGNAGWLLLAPTTLVAIQFMLLANGKPPEYARFGLLADTFLLVATFTALSRLAEPHPRIILAVATTALTLCFAFPYVRAFLRDARPSNSRIGYAQQIQSAKPATVVVTAEPAPYAVPPVNLFVTRLLLVRPGEQVAADVHVIVDSYASSAPISWADVRLRRIRPLPQIEQARINLPESEARRAGATTVSSPR